MSADCFPYEYYDADRFAPLEDQILEEHTVEALEEEFTIWSHQ
jgi:hypothetical protein